MNHPRFRTSLAAALLALAAPALAHELGADDRRFLEKAAEASLLEVELGKVAQRRGMRDEVKEFANRMVDDHGRTHEEVIQLAQSRAIEVPTALDRDERKEVDEMARLSGPEFDRAYMRRMVSEHKELMAEFLKRQRDAKDPEVKAFASKTLLALRAHLHGARGTEGLTRASGKEGAPSRP